MLTLLRYNKTIVVVGITIVLCAISGGLAYLGLRLNNFAVTPDTSGLACAAESLAETGQPRVYEILPTMYEMCWLPTTYPALQHLHAALLRLLPLSHTTLVNLTSSIVYGLCVLAIGLIGWLISHRPLGLFLTGVLAAVNPALLRALVLTPQNLYGYLLIICGVGISLWAIQTRRRWWLLSLVPLLYVLHLTHTLSFGIAGLIFVPWVCLALLPSWKLKLSLLPVLCLGVAAAYYWGLIPKDLTTAARFLFDNGYPGIYRPLWDHPAIWGYITTALAAIGVFLVLPRKPLPTISTWLILMVGLVPILLGHLDFLGIRLLPNRFIPFAWISLVPLAALGLLELHTRLRLQQWMFTVIITLLVSAQAVHGIVFMQDDINGWSARYRPEAEFREALIWLDHNRPAGRLLGVQSAINQEILLAPLWYHGHTVYYPWYSLNHRDITNFAVINASSPFASIFSQPDNPVYQRLHQLYYLITQPKSPEAKTAVQTQQLNYLILWKRSPDFLIWQAAQPKKFKLIYENEFYVIYRLHKP